MSTVPALADPLEVSAALSPRPQDRPALAPVSVTAQLNFAADDGVPHKVVFTSDRVSPETQGNQEARWIEIQNARVLAGDVSLDAEGFELRTHRSAVTDFENDEEVRRVYYPEIVALVKEATGASRVEIFDHTVRKDVPGASRQPASRMHVDYTEKSAPQRIRDIVGDDEADRLLKKRHIQVNIWRSIAGVVHGSPLALLDAQSLKGDNLVRTEMVYRHTGRIGETYGISHADGQQWYYYPHMSEDEAVLIKGYDSLTDGRARFTPHGAFQDPTTPDGAPPRESIEVRTFAFFDD